MDFLSIDCNEIVHGVIDTCVLVAFDSVLKSLLGIVKRNQVVVVATEVHAAHATGTKGGGDWILADDVGHFEIALGIGY